MMFSFTSPTRTAVFLARIVIPFSRSRSIESMTRSFTSWFSRNEPACQRRASTSVVLPWSTWATMATFLRSSRVAVRLVFGTASTVAFRRVQADRGGRKAAPFRDSRHARRPPEEQDLRSARLRRRRTLDREGALREAAGVLRRRGDGDR